MWPVSRTIDRFDTTFDHDGLISNAGLIVTATLMVRLGLEQLTTALGSHRGTERGPQDLHARSRRCWLVRRTSITSTWCVLVRRRRCCRSR